MINCHKTTIIRESSFHQAFFCPIYTRCGSFMRNRRMPIPRSLLAYVGSARNVGLQ